MSCNPFAPKPDYLGGSYNRSNFTLTDRKGGSSKYIAENPSRYQCNVFEVDGNLMPPQPVTKNEPLQCDYLLLVCKQQHEPPIPRAIFIELKGSDFYHGIEQLENSIRNLKQHLNGYKIMARLIATKSVNRTELKDEKFRKLLLQLGERSLFECKNDSYSERL